MKRIEKNNVVALLLLALTACTQDIPDIPAEGELISFSIPEVVTPDDEKPASRATLINSKLPLDSQFGVMGYCVARNIKDNDKDDSNSGNSNWEDKKELSRPDILNQAPLRVDEYGCYYEDNTKLGRWYTDQSFPGVSAAGFKYTFIAYHPFEGRFAITTPHNSKGLGAPTLTYTVVYGTADGQASGDTDNRIERNPELTTDAMYAQVKDHVRASGAVDLQFHHIMSGFSVQLNNYNESPVTVTSVTLDGGFYTTESVDFSTPDPTLTVGPEKYWGTFQFIRNGTTVTVPGGSSLKAGATADKPDGTVVLLLPNLSASEGTYLGTDKNITVKYIYNGNDKTATIQNFNLGRTPQPGLNYRLNLNFVGNQLLLMFTADDVEYWEEGSDNNIIIN